VRLHRSAWQDAWLTPTAELVVGCVFLVLSWEWFWETSGAIWQDWHRRLGTVATVLGPWFVYRAWRRKT